MTCHSYMHMMSEWQLLYIPWRMSAFEIFSGMLCLLGVTQWALKYLLRCGSNRYPDGPRPLGIFGNVLILNRLQSCPDRELMSIARSCGDTCMLWAARYPMLILNKPHVVKELLVDVRTSMQLI